MPLHAKREGVIRIFDGLHETVGSPGHGDEARSEPADALVMQAVHADCAIALQRLGQPGISGYRYRMGQIITLVLPEKVVGDGAGHTLGHIFPQRAAEGDVKELQAAADSQ